MDVLANWDRYALDASVYLVPGSKNPTLESSADVLHFDPERGRTHGDAEYLLGIEQIRDVVQGLEAQIGRRATPSERLRATLHYARHDAFIDPADALES